MRLKKRLIFCCIFVCMFMMVGMSARAEEKEYDISSADFEVILNRDGSADVTEEWVVTYTEGEFTRFYKDIYKDVTKLEKYDDIQFNNFWINDISCDEAYDTSTREDYTYYLSDENKLYNMQWYYHAEDESVVYRVEYTISDVVKETDDDVAWHHERNQEVAWIF